MKMLDIAENVLFCLILGMVAFFWIAVLYLGFAGIK